MKDHSLAVRSDLLYNGPRLCPLVGLILLLPGVERRQDAVDNLLLFACFWEVDAALVV